MTDNERHMMGVLDHLLEVINEDSPKAIGVVVTIVREDGSGEINTLLSPEHADAHLMILERSVEALEDVIETRKAGKDESGAS